RGRFGVVLMSDTGASGAAARAQADRRTLAHVLYPVHLVAPSVVGLAALIGALVPCVGERDGEPRARSHFRRRLRSLWVGFALAMIAAVALMAGVGLLFIKLAGAVVAEMPADGWSAVSRDLDVSFPVAAFVSLIVAGFAWLATAAWMILSSVVGAVRLS